MPIYTSHYLISSTSVTMDQTSSTPSHLMAGGSTSRLEASLELLTCLRTGRRLAAMTRSSHADL